MKKKTASDKRGPEELSIPSRKGRGEREADAPHYLGRRSFLGKFGGLASVAMAAGAIPLEPLLGGKHSTARAAVVSYDPAARAAASLSYRNTIAAKDDINVGVIPDNGDAALYPDKSGSYSKALAHDALGKPNLAAWNSLLFAMSTGNPADFEAIINGTPGGGPNSRHNGPQGALALDAECLDSHAFIVPPAPAFASAQTASEEVEHYWAALLRDVAFTDYATNPTANQAARELTQLSDFRGAKNGRGHVTPHELFRGTIPQANGSRDVSNTMGPYLSQFMVQPTFFGAQPISQQFRVFQSIASGGSDYMTSVVDYMTVANGGSTGRSLRFDPVERFLRNGRDLSAWTHVDVLYQGYLVAFLVLGTIGAPPNPGNPYIGSLTQKPFSTFGGPDAGALVGEVAARALNHVWFQKWRVHMRQRPEEQGAVVHLIKTGQGSTVNATVHPDCLHSHAVRQTFETYGTHLLPQVFPEGSPTHPCYPTGHGTVGGAAITLLKFFFDGSQKIQPLLKSIGRDVYVPSRDGLSLNTYGGSDADDLTINSELSKLAFNVSFGHGIHAGIHYRSSSDQSILLGEAMALSLLKDKAKSYNEKFTINITKLDGTIATISNE